LSRLVVLLSGRGSNFCALADAVEQGQLKAEIVLVVSNRATAGGLDEARRRGIPVAVIEHSNYPDRSAFDQQLAQQVLAVSPDWVVLAGFMRILSSEFIDQFAGRLVNIHPSLLPAYPGLHTHRRALADGVDEHGATVHLVTEALDGGPVLGRVTVPVCKGDTEATLAERVLRQEHRLYPWVLSRLLEQRLQWDPLRGQLFSDGMPSSGIELAEN
jgi:phosphoribosylglycinamide formyltransferase-1